MGDGGAEPIVLLNQATGKIAAFACGKCHVVASSPRQCVGTPDECIAIARDVAMKHCGPWYCDCGAERKQHWATCDGCRNRRQAEESAAKEQARAEEAEKRAAEQVAELEHLRRQVDSLQTRGTELVEENRRLRAGSSPFQEMVREFHVALDLPVRTTPTVPSDDEVRLRARLIAEEAFEVLGAMFPDIDWVAWFVAVRSVIAGARVAVDLPALAHELADLHYVVSGTAVQLGIDEAAVFRAVHEANVKKAGGGMDERGKALRPTGWSPANIAEVLRAQGWRGGEEPR